MSRLESNGPQDDPQLPPELQDALARLHEQTVAVPRRVDARVLAQARLSYARQRRRWLAARWAGAALAAAAALALALHVFVANPASGPHPTAAPPHQLARLGDVNGDGHVNILDAYVVANALAHHQPLNPAWDVNGDGVIDQKDVDLIAHMAVQISTEGPR
jgi:hypothetical protein